MVFAPTNNPNDTSSQSAVNLAFFPAVTVAGFRTATRAQDTVTDERVLWALQTAVFDCNRDLSVWRQAQVLLGYATLAAVPAVISDENYAGISEREHHYLTAVYARAKAQIIDYYHDADTTEEGLRRFIGFDATAPVYLREATEALRNVQGLPHITVELI